MNTRMKFLEHELAEQEREQQKKVDVKEQPDVAVPDNVAVLERKVKELEAMINGLTEEMLDLKSVTRKLSAQIEKLGGMAVKSHPETLLRGMKKPEDEPVSHQTRNIQSGSTLASFGAGEPGASAGVAHGSFAQSSQRRAPVSERPAPNATRVPVRRPVPGGQAPVSSERKIQSPVPEPVRVEDDNVENLKAGEYEFVMQPDGTIQKRKKTTAQNVIIAGTGYGPGRTSRSSAIRADSHAVIEADEDDTLDLDK